MVDQQTLGRQVPVPSLLPAVLDDEELVAVDVALQEQGLVGIFILLVPDGQGVIGSGIGNDVVDPTHEVLLIGRVAYGGIGVVGIATGVHDVPVAHAVVAAVVRVVEVGQTQAVTELVAEGADTVDGRTVVVAAVHLVEHGEVVHIGAAAIGSEGAVTTQTIVGGRLEIPVAGPDGAGSRVRGLSLADTGVDDDDHVAEVVAVGIKTVERYAVGSSHLAGFGHHRAQTLVVTARVIAAVVLAVLGQRVDAEDLKVGVVLPVGLISEILLNARVAGQHGLDDLLAGILELLVLVLDEDDGHLACTIGRHIRVGVAATDAQFALTSHTGELLDGHRQVGTLGSDKGLLGGGALVHTMGANGGQSRQRRGVVEVAVVATSYRQPVTGQ